MKNKTAIKNIEILYNTQEQLKFTNRNIITHIAYCMNFAIPLKELLEEEYGLMYPCKDRIDFIFTSDEKLYLRYKPSGATVLCYEYALLRTCRVYFAQFAKSAVFC